MAERDIIVMSKREVKRLHVIQKAMEKQVTQQQAGGMVGVTDRQIRRMVRRIRKEGEGGISHKGRGKPSNRAIPKKVKKKALALCQKHYEGFGPTLATEKLQENHQIVLGKGTLRLWLSASGVDYPTRSARPHRKWRERKPCRGEMVQIDGSHHRWLEDRLDQEFCLMAFIDDATGEVFARFYDYEGTFPALDGFRRYVESYGVPLSVYCDRHTTYKSNAKETIEDDLEGIPPMSQFERALQTLEVKVIHAYSPQAKGRVERSFRTLQDRLIKEMRLARVCTVEKANRFLETYLPKYNRKFRVVAADAVDMHRKIPSRKVLDQTLCIHEKRTLKNDFTLSYQGQLYQVKENIRARRVVVEAWLDGSIHVTAEGRSLSVERILTRPVKEAALLKPKKSGRRLIRPAANHPWRRQYKNRQGKEAAVPVTSAAVGPC